MATKPRLLPIPDVPNRRHPAYDACFEAYLMSGGSISRALKLVEEMWDPDQYGADIPTDRALRKWVREDNWDVINRQYALENKPLMRQALNARIMLLQHDMLNVMVEVAHDTESDHAKINSVRMGSARHVLQLAAAGVQENQRGDMPDYDIEGQEALKRVRSMTPEQILDAEVELAEEFRRESNGA